MSTINTESIAGFGEMTAEQKVEALLSIEMPDLSGYVKKDVFDKASSELAAAKKAIKDKMTEEEQAAADRDARWKEMETKLAQLEREKTESTYRAKYLSIGYDDALATETAKAMADGDMEKVFANMAKATEEQAKRIKADLLKDTPVPGGGKKTDDKPEAVKQAEALGKARADADKTSQEILAKFF